MLPPGVDTQAAGPSQTFNTVVEKPTQSDHRNDSSRNMASVDIPGVTDDIGLAVYGVNLMLNNDWQGSGQLFAKHKEDGPVLHFCNSFQTFLQALMSSEDDRLAEAQASLEETQKRCESSKGFGKKKSELDLADQLQRKIIIADTLVFQAILAFANQELSGYIKGGWYVRKAWKIYSKKFKVIKDMYDGKQTVIEDNDEEEEEENGKKTKHNKGSSAENLSRKVQNGELSDEVVTRLLGSVSFGFGLLHLCLAMLPPKVLKIVEFLGFEGSKTQGIWCLEFASKTTDLKGPLASFALIWYHTVIRPFFALDGTQVDAGVKDAQVVIERVKADYENSALFNWFRGRVHRLQGKIDEALTTYKTALEQCGDLREIQLTCLHEIGYCNMMKLQWAECNDAWVKLKEESRWSKSYYAYLSAVCLGAGGDLKGAHEAFKECISLRRKKGNNQIENFAVRRCEKFKRAAPTREHCTLLALEVLYLWHTIPQCSREDVQKMAQECSAVMDKKLLHLSSLVEGVLQRELGQHELAVTCWEEAIARHEGMKEDGHVAAFAMYELASYYSEKVGGYEQARKYFQQAKDMKDYDFENRLHIRIHAGIKKLKEEGSAV